MSTDQDIETILKNLTNGHEKAEILAGAYADGVIPPASFEHRLAEILAGAYADGRKKGWEECMAAVMLALRGCTLGGTKHQEKKVVLPHPCDGPLFKDWSMQDQRLKVYSEFMEAGNVLNRWEKSKLNDDRIKFGLETADIIVAVTTWQDMAGFDERGRQWLLKQVNESNRKRDGGKRFKTGGSK